MENNEKSTIETMENVSDAAVEEVSGGANIKSLICCTCGAEIRLTEPMMTEYFNHNICPRCKGKLKTW